MTPAEVLLDEALRRAAVDRRPATEEQLSRLTVSRAELLDAVVEHLPALLDALAAGTAVPKLTKEQLRQSRVFDRITVTLPDEDDSGTDPDYGL